MPENDDKHPPLRFWGQTESMLAQVVTELRGLQAILIQVNSKKGSKKPKVEPVLTPLTAISRVASKVKWDRRLRRHDELVRKLLPGRQPE